MSHPRQPLLLGRALRQQVHLAGEPAIQEDSLGYMLRPYLKQQQTRKYPSSIWMWGLTDTEDTLSSALYCGWHSLDISHQPREFRATPEVGQVGRWAPV